MDAHLCAEPFKYMSALLLSLGTMLHLARLPPPPLRRPPPAHPPFRLFPLWGGARLRPERPPLTSPSMISENHDRKPLQELPHVNVLSKVDLLGRYGPLAFGLDYYLGERRLEGGGKEFGRGLGGVS